jgi:deoxyuridine 5'-triphosphate nucleotidohydrolase
VRKLTDTAILPTRVHGLEEKYTDVGLDLYSDSADTTIPKWDRRVISTGLAVEIPAGCYGRVASRSGLSCKENVDVEAGVIDRGNRGDVKVCLVNSSGRDFVVERGTRIAQLIVEKAAYPEIVCVTELSDGERGVNGFGSSGI